MKKSYKFLPIIIVVLMVWAFVYSYFHVSGSEITGISQVITTSSVVVKKSYLESTEPIEFKLNETQIEMLMTLIKTSDFTRDLSSWVTFEDHDYYAIIINDNEQDVWLVIHSIGGEYISISNQFNGKHLKINNPKWKETLEQILALSN